MEVRIFNEKGIEQFRTFLETSRNANAGLPSRELLLSDQYSEIFVPESSITLNVFSSKKEFVEYLVERIDVSDNKIFYNNGLWAWMAAYFFDQICPMKNGRRNVKDEAKYILNTEHWGRYYRHLIVTPLRLFKDLGPLSEVYLSGSLSNHGEILEQLASRQELATNRGVIEAVTALYWDQEKQEIKRGARSKTGRGILRRFTRDIIPQFQVTYDLNAMTGKDILKLLPKEFDVWK